MAQGNAWTDHDVEKMIRQDGELMVHRKFENYQGLRDHADNMQRRGLIKEVHVNNDYRFYKMTQKGSESRSKRRK